MEDVRTIADGQLTWRDEFRPFFNNANEKSPAFDNIDACLIRWKSASDHFGLTFWVL